MIVRNLINWLNTQIYIKIQINWLSTIPRLTYLFHQPCFPSFSCCFLVLVWYHSESRKHFNPKFEKWTTYLVGLTCGNGLPRVSLPKMAKSMIYC
ncbi:hypothetical protein VIGAN_04178300 [Vigna angularis var. angularis]|uniref:Uncharacterized protein n=1 Tax=Vigna angularis var. angularis TaxID=157739 RepID=A0A0S3RV10_PHAAN|nr:hypothetical protein VIGAN_04178300 [Vigna angularis var. angularis]